MTTGIMVPKLLPPDNSWHNSSLRPLNSEYKEIFKIFIDYFEKEADIIDDSQLEKELSQLTSIYELDTPTSTKQEPPALQDMFG